MLGTRIRERHTSGRGSWEKVENGAKSQGERKGGKAGETGDEKISKEV